MLDIQSRIQISERGQAMPASPIRKLVPYQEKAAARGVKVFHLNIGQPDIPTPPLFYDAIEQARPTVLEYSHSAGLSEYRQALAKYYQKFSPDVRPEHILVTTGGSEALLFALLACFNPGDEVIVFEPCYANYIGYACQTGIQLAPITCEVRRDFALPSPAVIREYVHERTRGILLCNPSNPTGKLYQRAELEVLADLARQYNLVVISDEVYSEFVYDGEIFNSFLSFENITEQVVIIDSISKRYSACGARVGSFVTRNAEIYAAVMKFAQARLSPPTLGQLGATAVSALDDDYYRSITVEYQQRRDFVLQALSQMPGVICPHVAGAFYVMPELPIDDCDRFCQWLLESFDYKGATVMLAPGSGFYATPGMGTREARIAYVLNLEVLSEAMECLSVALEQYPGRQ